MYIKYYYYIQWSWHGRSRRLLPLIPGVNAASVIFVGCKFGVLLRSGRGNAMSVCLVKDCYV
jgi:hypothetical protein